MSKHHTRRRLLGVLGTVPFAGCLGTEDDPDSPDHQQNQTNDSSDDAADESPVDESLAGDRGDEERDTTDGVPEGCVLEDKQRQGQGPKMEVVAEVESSADIQQTCADEAAQAALDQVIEKTELDPEKDSTSPWMSTSRLFDGEDYKVGIRVRERVNAEGNHVLCPPPEYEFESVLKLVPERVTVELNVLERQERLTCSHNIYLRQSTEYWD